MMEWLTFKIPLAVYCIVVLVCMMFNLVAGVVIAVAAGFVVVPWLIFAKWLCREVEKSKKFNGRK